MDREGLPPLAIETFRYYYAQLLAGETGRLGAEQVEPLTDAPDAEQVAEHTALGLEALRHAVVIKLNGGLGTSMGLDRAKTLLVARKGLTFLQIIIRQMIRLRRKTGCAIPLLFMNSYSTEADTRSVLDGFPDLRDGQRDVPFSFLQYKVPKIRRDTFEAVAWPDDPALEWCPPGHGEIYVALAASGLLDRLLALGCRYAFVSNSDNLSAALDVNILGYFAARKLPFMMEVADRTEADRKGGHVARLKDGRLVLRELAQCPAQEMDDFQNTEKHAYFNTNNLWIDLAALKAVLDVRHGILGLPLIRNSKTVDPRDEHTLGVYHLETAMGSAISVFPGAEVLRVPRSRFSPVKTTDDLLAVRSDAFVLTPALELRPNPQRWRGALVVDLDHAHYRLINQFEARFPAGPPSLWDCESLTVRGDVRFGKGVILQGRVNLSNTSDQQMVVRDGELIADY